MQQQCGSCGSPFTLDEADLAFYGDLAPTFDKQRFAIPPPAHCPDCRLQRRLMFRNDRHFYHRPSAKSGKQIITIYSPDKPYTVFDKEEWWGDDWDPKDFGRDIDFSRTFAEQFRELRVAIPRVNLFTSNAENSYFTNHALNMKNCHLIWGGGNDEDSLYGNYIAFCKDTVDGLALYSCERCYEGIASERCYNCSFFMNCRDCIDCLMIEECSSCKNCIGCFGLHQREYCLFNEQFSKEEWERRRRELGTFLFRESMQMLRERLKALKATLPHRASHIFSSEDCTGDNIYNSRNCRQCFDVTDCEDSRFVAFTPQGISTYDATFTAPEGLEKSYFVCSSLGGQRMLFTFLAYYCNDTYYSMECHYSKHLFGCASMRHSEYCILNKQYTKEEYEKLVAKLIAHMQETGEWGDYFPPALAPIAYNESNAADYFPLTKEQALEQGLQWRDEDPVVIPGAPMSAIPQTIEKVDASICEHVLTCEISKKPYKIIPQEWKFYKDMGLPLPLRCANQRHLDRLGLRNPRKLWKRACSKCGKGIETTYQPSRPEIVYCEECYLASIY